jgi:multidrug resistance protein MdtO
VLSVSEPSIDSPGAAVALTLIVVVSPAFLVGSKTVNRLVEQDPEGSEFSSSQLIFDSHMATTVTVTSRSSEFLTWFWEFLKEELAPYPRRGTLIARMLIASTLSMIVTMTFRIPFGAYGAIWALTISRESTVETVSTVKRVTVAFVLSGTYILIGSIFFAGDPMLRFIWVIGSLFVTFYVLSAATNYVAASRFGYVVVVTIPLWDSHTLPDIQVADTLWAIWAMTIASVITVAIELIFAHLKPWDDIAQSIAERLACVEQVLDERASDRGFDNKTRKQIGRLSMLGTSRLRRTLQRAPYSPRRAEEMAAIIALTGRLVDLAANMSELETPLPANANRHHLGDLAATIANIRADIVGGGTPRPIQIEVDTAPGVPLLHEMQRTVSLISDVSTGAQPLGAYTTAADASMAWTMLVPDAFSNPEHLKFALKGCLAAGICYFTYNALDWPAISTAVATCLLTALSTVGASRQKQILRFAGAIIGGVVLGMGGQIFILPHLGSIAGFTVYFVAAISVAAWFASSGRLSYLGFQIAAAFCLINVQEFKIQTSLSLARDRVVGILLGLSAMWLVFDQIWGAPAAVEMKRTFIASLRLLAEFARGPRAKDLKSAFDRSSAMRETINKSLAKVHSMADGVLLEFGSSRQIDMALRSQIIRWQSQLRVILVTRAALVKYRYDLPGFELPDELRAAQQEFDESLAQTLEGMADRLDGNVQQGIENDLESSLANLERVIERCRSSEPAEPFSLKMQTFLPLSRRIETLALSLDREI